MKTDKQTKPVNHFPHILQISVVELWGLRRVSEARALWFSVNYQLGNWGLTIATHALLPFRLCTEPVTAAVCIGVQWSLFGNNSFFPETLSKQHWLFQAHEGVIHKSKDRCFSYQLPWRLYFRINIVSPSSLLSQESWPSFVAWEE